MALAIPTYAEERNPCCDARAISPEASTAARKTASEVGDFIESRAR